MKKILIILFGILALSCAKKSKETKLSAKDIIGKAIEVSGGESFNQSKISFSFRDITYLANRHNGNFTLGRAMEVNGDSIIDFLSNDGFARFINNEFIELSDSLVKTYSASVNSVHYFSVLPYGLNDAAVKKQLLREEHINNADYYVVRVSFEKNGGGEDYEDIFIYWINKETFKPDYIAYSYNEDDGLGVRFRAANNERYVKGLRFVDYNNYKSKEPLIELTDLAKAFENNKLELLSKIELEDVKVDLIDH